MVAARGVEMTALGGFRGSLERNPRRSLPPEGRDPFETGEDRALEALKLRWADSYVLRVRNGMYEAIRRQRPHKTLGASTPDGLSRLLLDDSRSW